MRLDDKVSVLKKSTSTDTYGETTATFSTGRSFWADAQVQRPNERREGSAVEESVRVVLAARTEDVSDLTADDRLKYDGDTLRVNGKRDHTRDGFAELFCTRVR